VALAWTRSRLGEQSLDLAAGLPEGGGIGEGLTSAEREVAQAAELSRLGEAGLAGYIETPHGAPGRLWHDTSVALAWRGRLASWTASRA
jgi:hypothetical protein